jgi:hypothetical protein
MPVIIANAVGISSEFPAPHSFSLVQYGTEPNSNRAAADVQSTSLEPEGTSQGTSTVFHAQIPSSVADLLEIQIADRSSSFYNGPDAALASHVAGEI